MLEVKKSKIKTALSPIISSGVAYTLTEDVLHYFGLNGVYYISKVEAPEVYSEIKNFKNLTDLSDYFDNKQDIPSSFFETLNFIYMVRGERLLNHFEKQGLKRNEKESDGEFSCRIFFEEGDLFSKISKRLEGSVKPEGTSFSVSRLKKGLLRSSNHFSNREVDLEKECITYFKDQGYTDHCILKLIEVNGREGFRVERGSHLSHLPVLERKKRLTRSTVIRKVDTIFFDKETSTVWVYAKGQRHQDISFYTMLATKYLTGNGLSFENLNFDLSFVKEKHLKRKLDTDRNYAERLILRRASFSKQLDSCLSSPLKTSAKRKECLTDVRDFSYNAENISSFTGVELKVVINEDEGIYDQVIISSGRIQYSGILKLTDVFELLSDLEISSKSYDA